MKLELKNYRVVVIDFPALCMDDPKCSILLGKALKMKLDGYALTYSENVLPFDKTDFFGTHIMFCEIKADELIPVFAYKAAPLDRCLKFYCDFPLHSIIENNNVHSSVLARVNEIIDHAGDPSKVSFDSSWAQNLDYRFNNDPEQKEHLREIMMMVIVKHHQDHKIPHMLTAGAVKVKTDLFFERIGLKPVNENSRFTEIKMDNAEGVLFYNDSFSFEALSMAKKYQDLWDKRLVIDGMEIQKQKMQKRAA